MSISAGLPIFIPMFYGLFVGLLIEFFTTLVFQAGVGTARYSHTN